MSLGDGVGRVFLVGSGPGDPGLVTVRAMDLIRSAEVLAYDRLIPAGLVEQAPEACERVDVGKRPDRHALPQDQINALLVDRALAGRRVVRLKGGDPFVFGRGGEEAEACVEAGVPFEIVPGVTSAVAVPAYAGIPVTHRDLVSGFTVVTGHEDPLRSEARLDWAALASAGTLCVLMGVERLAGVAQRLIEGGRAGTTPAALIERGTLPGQRVVVSTLDRLGDDARAAGIRPPAVLVVGDVVTLRARLAWLEQRPLQGHRVLVPRARRQAGVLSALLRDRGAEPLEAPTIEIDVPDPSAPHALDEVVGTHGVGLGAFSWIALTSANGVDALRHRVEKAGGDARALGGVRVAAVGPATADALAAWGIRPDLVADPATTEALGRAFPPASARVGSGVPTVLLPRADIATTELPVALRDKGWGVEEVVAYRTRPVQEFSPSVRRALEDDQVHWLAFTASSTVEGFVRAWPGPLPPSTKVAAIGPVTAQAVRDHGLRLDVEATEHTIPGLVAAIEGVVSGERRQALGEQHEMTMP